MVVLLFDPVDAVPSPHRTRHSDQTNFKLTQNVKQIIGILSFLPCFSTTGCPSRRPAAPLKMRNIPLKGNRSFLSELEQQSLEILLFIFLLKGQNQQASDAPHTAEEEKSKSHEEQRRNVPAGWHHQLVTWPLGWAADAGSWCGRIAARQQQQPARSPCRRCARRVSPHWRRRLTAPPSGQDDTRDSSVTLKPLQSFPVCLIGLVFL